MLTGKPERQTADNITMETVWEGVDWIHMVQIMDHWQSFSITVTNG
jgi:hypothetical protein